MKYCPNCWKDSTTEFYEESINYFSCCAMPGSYVPPSVRLVQYKIMARAKVYIGFALGLALGIAFALVLFTTKVPQCQEDESIIGSGNFSAGRWSAYVCGPAVDDFIE